MDAAEEGRGAGSDTNAANSKPQACTSSSLIVSVFKRTTATRSDPETPETVAPVAPLQLHVMAAPDIITSLGTATVELESIAARIAETQAQFVRSTADVPHLLGVLRSTRCAQSQHSRPTIVSEKQN